MSSRSEEDVGESMSQAIYRRLHATLLTLTATIVCISSVRADRVELVTGEVFFGDILRADEREVSVRLKGGGVISFTKARVRYYRRNLIGEDGMRSRPQLDAPREWSNDQPASIPQRKPPVQASGTFPSFDPAPVAPTQTTTATKAGNTSDGARRLPTDPKLVEPRFSDSERSFSIAPPKGFFPGPEHGDARIAAYFRDLVHQANLTILTYPSSESIEAIKRRAARSYALQVSNFKVVRDQPLVGAPFRAWLFDVKSTLAGESVRQVQIFASNEESVFVLTYSSSARNFEKLRESIAESIRSFEILQTPTEKEPSDDEATQSAEDIPEKDTSNDLRSLLRRR